MNTKTSAKAQAKGLKVKANVKAGVTPPPTGGSSGSGPNK